MRFQPRQQIVRSGGGDDRATGVEVLRAIELGEKYAVQRKNAKSRKRRVRDVVAAQRLPCALEVALGVGQLARQLGRIVQKLAIGIDGVVAALVVVIAGS